MGAISAWPLQGIPRLAPGDDLAGLIAAGLGEDARSGQVLCIAHTAVSKVEGALVELGSVTPSAEAQRLAAEQGKDPRIVEVVLQQSVEVLRARSGVLITRTRHGFVCANSGVDASNSTSPDTVVLLPADPDGSARGLRVRIAAELGWSADRGPSPAVLISDTFGRAWRNGQVDVAIGLAGFAALEDWRGRHDAEGLELQATWLAVADAAAAAADLARTKDSQEPIVVVEGLERFVAADDGPGAAELLRPLESDLFR